MTAQSFRESNNETYWPIVVSCLTSTAGLQPPSSNRFSQWNRVSTPPEERGAHESSGQEAAASALWWRHWACQQGSASSSRRQRPPVTGSENRTCTPRGNRAAPRALQMARMKIISQNRECVCGAVLWMASIQQDTFRGIPLPFSYPLVLD